MSQRKVFITLTIPDHRLQAANYRPVSRDEALKHPDRAEYRWSGVRGPVYGIADAWKLRTDFLECPADEWKGFLEKTGYVVDRISQNDFAEWRSLMRTALVTPPKEWHLLVKKYDPGKVSVLLSQIAIRFDWSGDAPIAELRSNRALEQIIVSIQLDALEGAKFRLCARHDCNAAPFRIGNRLKQFCSYECAHLAAVRRSREHTPKTEKRKSHKGKP
jgi:hypothetical protein